MQFFFMATSDRVRLEQELDVDVKSHANECYCTMWGMQCNDKSRYIHVVHFVLLTHSDPVLSVFFFLLRCTSKTVDCVICIASLDA